MTLEHSSTEQSAKYMYMILILLITGHKNHNILK